MGASVGTARTYVTEGRWDRQRKETWDLGLRWVTGFVEAPYSPGPDLLPELTAEGTARLAEILSRPGRRIPKLAAVLARKK